MTTLGIITIVISLIVTGLGLTAQVRKNHKRKSMEGLSLFYFSVLAVSYSFWVVYGISQRDFVLIIPMCIGSIMSWIVVIQFYVYKS
jgi:uncharacterized protein with PQ loop repeat